MPDVKIYLYANCSSCRNALAMLQASGLDLEVRDIFRNRLSEPELRDLFVEIERTPNDVLSRRSIPYRELGLAESTPADDRLIGLMSEYPALLRRPIIIGGGANQVGFNRGALERMIESIQQGKSK